MSTKFRLGKWDGSEESRHAVELAMAFVTRRDTGDLLSALAQHAGDIVGAALQLLEIRFEESRDGQHRAAAYAGLRDRVVDLVIVLWPSMESWCQAGVLRLLQVHVDPELRDALVLLPASTLARIREAAEATRASDRTAAR